jgi:hypothetical protein
MKSRLCGADTLVREKLEPRLVKAGLVKAGLAEAKASAILTAIHRSLTVLVEVLREIFDESAYQRFLDRSQLQSSPNAYAIFLKENEQAKSRRPRCC